MLKLLEKRSINSGTLPTVGKRLIQKKSWGRLDLCVWKKIVSPRIELMLLRAGLFNLEMPGREDVVSERLLSVCCFVNLTKPEWADI